MTKLSRNEIVSMSPAQLNEAVAIEAGWEQITIYDSKRRPYSAWSKHGHLLRHFDISDPCVYSDLLDDLIARGRDFVLIGDTDYFGKPMYALIDVDEMWSDGDEYEVIYGKFRVRRDEWSSTRGEAIARAWLVVVNEEKKE